LPIAEHLAIKDFLRGAMPHQIIRVLFLVNIRVWNQDRR
jgi:hypothetical protein